MIKKVDYSFVIPIFNEEKIILELWRRLSSIIKQLDKQTEVIFINDGSVDSSWEILVELSRENREVKILNLSRNFGHQTALAAGIDHAEGQAVIIMDGDLQDTPESIMDFIQKWQEGYDVVYAIRRKRKEKWLKKVAFKSFYRIQRTFSQVPIPLDAGIFSLMDRKVVLALRQMPERNKYLSGLRAYSGFKQIGIPVERGPRYRGEPKVSILDLFKLAFDGIFSFSAIPLKIVTYLGLVFSVTAFIVGIIGLIVKFLFGIRFLAWPYGLTTTFFIGGIQFLCLGIIGEYIGRIYEEVKQRPYYIIDKKIGFE